MPKNERFPKAHLPAFTDGPHRYNLSESTTKDMQFGDLIDLIGIEAVRNFNLDYGEFSEGIPALREAIGLRNRFPSDQIVTTQGAAFALYLVAAELGGNGDEAIITAPYFQLSYNVLKAHNWQVQVVQNSFDTGYALNVEGISAELTATTRLVSISSPQNPSGVSTSLATIEKLLAIMAEKAPNAYLFIDETYREAAFKKEDMIASAASLSPRVITCASVSKAYGAPGLRTGWLTLPDPEIRQSILRAKENIVICDSVLTENLAAAILNNAEQLLETQRQHLAPPLAQVAAWQAAEQQRLGWVRPNAGALCCMRLSPTKFSDEAVLKFWHALSEHETFVRPGLKFGSDLRHFRLGFGHVSLETLAVGLQNISLALDSAES